MVSYFRTKDKRVRAVFAAGELTSLRLHFFLKNADISELSRQRLYLSGVNSFKHFIKFSTRSRNRCLITVRAGSVFRFFRLSRILIKELASRGGLPGIRKSSW
jgi:small subunit ribosomal protein S14